MANVCSAVYIMLPPGDAHYHFNRVKIKFKALRGFIIKGYQLPLAPPPKELPPPNPLELLPIASNFSRKRKSMAAVANNAQPHPVFPDLMQEKQAILQGCF